MASVAKTAKALNTESVEKVIKAPNTESVAKAIKAINSESVSAILIASSCATSGSSKGIAARKNVDKDDPKGNLKGSKVDVSNMYSLFMKCKIIKVVKTFDSIDDEKETTTRSAVLEAIGKMFNDTSRKAFILYYSGHGSMPNIPSNKQGGNWCFEERDEQNNKIKPKEITLNDILFLWDKRMKSIHGSQRLIIIADCCYSGAWVDQIKAMKAYKEVIIQASCRANEVCYDGANGGVFTSSFKDRCIIYKKNNNVKILAPISTLATIVVGVPLVALKDGVLGRLYNAFTSKFKPITNTYEEVELGIMDGNCQLIFSTFNSWNEMNVAQTVYNVGYVCTLGNVGNK